MLAQFGLIVAAMEIFRLTYYGSLIPNTFYAKAPVPTEGLGYVSAFFLHGVGVIGPLAVLPALRKREGRVLLVVIVVLAAGVLWSGGDWMPGFRRLSVFYVGLVVLMGLALGNARGREFSLVVAALVAVLFVQGRATWTGEDHANYPHKRMAGLGMAAARSPGVEVVALVDIGRFGWHFPGGVVDLVGLTDRHLSHLPGGHANKPWDEEWFRARSPDVLLARSSTPIEDPLLELPSVGRPEVGMVFSVLNHGGYRMHNVLRLAENQWLMVFARDGLTLSEEIWGKAWARSLRELFIERGSRGQKSITRTLSGSDSGDVNEFGSRGSSD